ncbi:MAG: type VI secretion system tip protein VgrG [Gammaproteobacteria bacterium]|nr:type VI secretion system tip protein VgrG [Gammaproteobacteria bacterium]
MALKQAARLVQVTTPLGSDKLLLGRMQAWEALGRPFRYELELLSEDPNLALDKLLGRPAGLRLSLPDGGERLFHGIVSECSQTTGQGQFAAYRATLRPWFWLLSRTSDCRIFQNMKVPDIIKQVFRDLGYSDFDDALSGSYRSWDYCVQYRETAFQFVSRLMEQEGIYYYFRHEKDRHVLVLSDAYGAHHKVAGYDTVPYYPPTGEQRERDHFNDWSMRREVQSGSMSLNDFDFLRPGARLEVRSAKSREHGAAGMPLYDYPGEYVQSSDGEHYAKTRLEALQTSYERVSLGGDVHGLGAGHLFKLRNYPRSDQNREYLVIGSELHIDMQALESGPGGASELVSCRLTAIDAQTPFRNTEDTPKPIAQGPQTAIVVGPGGEEIWTDQYGRVKVHFHWDRHDKSDENSSCWIRVSQLWAGKSWGGIHIPRIGQEVIVGFLEGDPDRPLITGRVYNAEQTVPYDLPANATQSGIKSRSSKGGSGANYNEFRFEDKKGEEQILFHAEKDELHEVEHDQDITVGNDRREIIGRDRTLNVGRDKTEAVDRHKTITVTGNHVENIGMNMDVAVASNLTESVGINYSETVGAAMELTVGGLLAITVGAAMSEVVGAAKTETIGASRSETIAGNRSIDVGQSMTENVAKDQTNTIGKNLTTEVGGDAKETVSKSYSLQAKKIQLVADDEISLKTGSAEIVLKKSGDITIKGSKITIKGSGDVVIKGSKIAEN